jgi:carboxypeptidase Q
MRRQLSLVVILLACSLWPINSAFTQAAAPAQQPQVRTDDQKKSYRTAMEQADQKIADEIKVHSELMKNLEYLCYHIGPRLTGSPQMQAASQWTLLRFKDYGVDAHLETTQIAHSWTRGHDTASLIKPVAAGVTAVNIEVRSAGWSKATPGEITANVVALPNLNSPAELDRYRSRIKGAIVLGRNPYNMPDREEPIDNAYDSVIPPQRGVARAGASERFRIMRMLAEAQPAAILFDSGKFDSLFNMTSYGRNYQPSEAPAAFITHEDYVRLHKLATDDPTLGAVQMKLNLTGTFSPVPVDASITVAEIKGAEHPEERVIVGGHLDSWDLGQGALDNGTGAMSVLEAARTLKALGWKPKRTITFILFTGEEQGGVGADAFIKNHQAELDKIDAVLVNDLGTGKIFTITMEGDRQWNAAPLALEIYTPLQEVFNMNSMDTRYYGSSDHVPFMNGGVPAFFTLARVAGYREAHHSQTDTFDKVVAETANEGAAIVAAWAWNVSEMPERLPHHAPIQPRGFGE